MIMLKDLQEQHQKLQASLQQLEGSAAQLRERLTATEQQAVATRGALQLNEHYIKQCGEKDKELPPTVDAEPQPGSDTPPQKKVVPLPSARRSGSNASASTGDAQPGTSPSPGTSEQPGSPGSR